jgi:hypothetical protein
MFISVYLQLYYWRTNTMTSNETIVDKALVEEKKVEIPKVIVDAIPVRIYSKPFDITARDNAKIEADKAAAGLRRLEMENIERRRSMPM